MWTTLVVGIVGAIAGAILKHFMPTITAYARGRREGALKERNKSLEDFVDKVEAGNAARKRELGSMSDDPNNRD